MLRLMDIQRMREREPAYVYLVTLDRDGKAMQYEFIWKPPPRPGWPDHVHEPMEVVEDLIDYQKFPRPGQPHGMLIIPPLDAIIEYVYKAADGKSLDFPIVLDEH